MTLNWKALWLSLFGTTDFLGINLGFWAAMSVTALIVMLMHLLFWTRKKAE